MDMVTFDKYSTRPPVHPGRDSNDPHTSIETNTPCSYTSVEPPSTPPVPLPRRGLPPSTERGSLPDGFAPLGFEPEGGSDHSPGGGEALSTSPPNCLEWAKCFNTLLNDPDGLHLFRKYLAAENQSDLLEFWFACEGLKKQTNQEQINLIVKCIYRRYFKDCRLGLSSEVFTSVLEEIRKSSRHNTNLSCKIFAESQAEVERIINDVGYRNFLQSDLYLNYIHHMTQDSCSGSTSDSTSGGASAGPPSSKFDNQNLPPSPSSSLRLSHSRRPPPSPPPHSSSSPPTETLSSLTENMAVPLPTLPEDSEFNNQKKPLPPGPRLTKDSILASYKKRTMLKPKPETFAGMFLKHPPRPNPYSLAYNSYNTVSRHDSDNQSLSSDARSASDLSLNTSCGNTLNRPRHNQRSSSNNEHQHPPRARQCVNKEHNLNNTIIPRSMHKKYPTIEPQQFVNELMEKLLIVKKNQETDEKLQKTLNEDIAMGGSRSSTSGLSDALSRFANCGDEDDQNILDQHIESVFDKIGLSPGSTTPHRPKSPDATGGCIALPPRGKGMLPPPPPPPLLPKVTGLPPPHHQPPMSRLDYLRHKSNHRDRDGTFSVFTSDSGNVQDLTDGTETLISYGNSSLSKSKSVPDYSLSFGDPSCMRQGSRRHIPKRSDSQIFDSGISVMSYNTINASSAPAIAHPHPPELDYHKNKNVTQWLMDSTCASSSVSVIDKDAMSTSTRLRHTTTVKHKSSSRSCSTERPTGSSTTVKKSMQPFLGDPSMPPLPQPHFPTQMEEVSRRLFETIKNPPAKADVNSATSTNFTTAVFTFCDEQLPYRIKIPSKPVTLKQFKDYLPKKGSFRFFFKTECDDVDIKVIQEEIVDDHEVLPLWEGKVMGQVKPLENDMGHY